MKVKIFVFVSVTALILFIYSCEKNQGAIPTTVNLNGCDTANLTYSSGTNQMKYIIDAQCGTGNSSCHAPHGTSGYDFSNFTVLQAKCADGSVYGDLFNGSPHVMPQIAQPGWTDSMDCYKSKFKQWLKIGYPQ